MKEIAALCPHPPDCAIEWDEIIARFAWVAALHGVEQEPEFHLEGDVAVHTRMACEELAASDRFRVLTEAERHLCFAATLMHDIGKPACTRREAGGSITSRGHSLRGAELARRILWRSGTPFSEREQIVAMIRHHESPFFVIDDPDFRRRIYGMSQRLRCDLLALAAEADGRGRECADSADQERILDNVELFVEYCREHGCLDRPRAFPSELSRFLYFHKADRDPDYEAYDDTRCEAVLMSGLPASGKDHWIAEHCSDLPMVSLDGIRGELGIDPAEPQGGVVEEGRSRAREHLRAAQSFVWNATNLSRDHRTRLVSLFVSYGATVRIVYLEAPEPIIRRRNRERESPSPERVINRMIDRWTVPDVTEAHRVEWQVRSGL